MLVYRFRGLLIAASRASSERRVFIVRTDLFFLSLVYCGGHFVLFILINCFNVSNTIRRLLYMYNTSTDCSDMDIRVHVQTDSTESRQLHEAIDATKGSERATCSIAEDGATSAERAKAERALRIAYRDKIVYDVRSGAKGDACLKGGRLIHADIVSSVCEAADAARAVTVTTGLVECSA